MRPKITNENKRKIIDALSEAPKLAYWQVAEQLGIHENTFSKWMRIPDDAHTELIMAAIADMRAAQ